jgi:cation diffusion facilitator family transporter
VHESRLTVLAALAGNLLIALLKLAAGILSGSAAMLAEAAHSFSDTGNQLLLLLGIRGASRPPTPDHPFGTGKAAYFWPFLVAILLFGVAGAYSAFEGIAKLGDPHPIGDPRLSLGILAASFAIETGSLFVALRQARRDARAAGIRSVRQFLEENRDATLLTILVEDSLALVGLVVAAAAIGLSAATGSGLWDALGSLAIGLILMGFAFFLANEVRALLLGRGLGRRDLEAIHRILEAEPSVGSVVSLQSMYLGPQSVLLGIEVKVADARAPDIPQTLARLERELRSAVPVLKYVFLEPQA